ncbi:winged helix DNA-binding protein [Candidatus Woesearchaeota archaeon]|nr:winged helix DNA-binding protein [Candidatus Woesearchaeota archaeon]
MYNVAFIIGSRVRKGILGLIDSPKTAKMLGKELDRHINTISRALREMEKKNMVVCLNPKNDRNRFYRITKKGKDVLRKVKDIEK